MSDSTRRRFTGSLLISSPVAAAVAAEQKAGVVRMPRKLRLGLIGDEGHPTEVTGPLNRLPDVELVSFAHADAAALARFRTPRGRAAPARYADYRRMLDAEKLDLVAVCNSNGDRGAAVLAVLERNLNVIAEKPLSIERAEYQRIRNALGARPNIKLGMLLPMRYEPHYQALRAIVASGAIGEVCQMDAQKSYKAGSRAEWFKKRASYGGTIAWIGIHMIDLMRYASGRDFRRTFGFQARLGAGGANGDMETTTSSVFVLDNGGTASLHMDYFRPETAPTHGDDRLRIAGSLGVAEYQASTGVTLLAAGRQPESIRDLPPQGSVFVDYLEWAYNGKPATLSANDIWRANEVTLAARDAAEQGRILDC
jgi:predicted dehydrogenase